MSVIVPVYNGADEIGRCIEALLAQDLPEAGREVVVVDNGSTDATAEVVARYPVRLVTEAGKVGSYAARNRGIEAARGRILAFTDADCVPDPAWLTTALAAFDDPAAYVVGGEIASAPPETEVEAFLAARDFLSHRHSLAHPFRPFFQTANVLIRREVFERVGRFNDELISGGDVDLSWRAQAAGLGPLRFVPEAVVVHRHRVDRDDMLRQRFKWGIGAGCMARLHRAEMGVSRHWLALEGYLRVGTAALRWLLALPGALFGAEGRRKLRWAGWEVRGTACWKAGYRAGYHRPASVRTRRL